MAKSQNLWSVQIGNCTCLKSRGKHYSAFFRRQRSPAARPICTPYTRGQPLAEAVSVLRLYTGRIEGVYPFPNTLVYQRRQLQEGNLYIFNTSGRPSNTTGLNYYNEASLFSKAIHLPSPTFFRIFFLTLIGELTLLLQYADVFFYTFCRSGDKLRLLLNDFTNTSTTVMDCIA